MAQVKKLQSGGTSPSNTQLTSKKRMYNGVELTDDDINNIISKVGDWGSKSSNYSEDIRGWGELGNKVKSQMLQGIMPEFSTTGTGMTLGNINVSEGKTNQNVFGNWSGEKLNRQYVSKLKEALDQYITPSNTETTETTNITNTSKNHKNISKVISDKYFGGNWENAQKGVNDWDINTRKNRIRESLVESITDYKSRYNEDSPYSSKINELNDPNISPEKLKEIAYSMGIDISEYFENNDLDQNKKDPYNDLKKQGEVIEDDYLTSKGLVGFKDKQGVTHLLSKNDLSQQYTDPNPVLETKWGQHYGKGIFYNPSLGYNWGDRTKFKSDNNYFNIAEPIYSQYEAKNKAGINESINSIDFNTQFDPTFSILRDKSTNKFDYIDATKYFSGLNTGDKRLIIPKNRIKYTSIGDIDLNNLNAYMYDKTLNKNVPVTIKLNPTGSSQAIGNNGKIYDLGIIGDNLGNSESINTTYNTSLGDYSNLDLNTEDRLRSRIVGFENRLVNKNNISDFLYQVNRQNFTNDLSPEEAKNLSNLVKKYYSQYKPILNQQSIINIQRALSKFDNSVNDIKSNKQFYKSQNGATSSFKQGGIIKYQVGGGIKSKISDKTSPLKKVSNPNLGYGSARIKDLNTSTFSDNADMVSTGLDALSLAGGAVGVGAGLASTLVQAVGDSNRSGFLSSDMLKNLGINLGFTALSFIPGASAVKIGKIAKTANKLKNASKFIKDTEKAVKVLSKVENVSDDAKKALKAVDMAKKVVANAEKGKDVTKFINKVTLNPITKGVATTARVGFSGLGISTGIDSAKNIIEDGGNARISDIRGLVAGVAGSRAALGIGRNALIRKGTELKTPINKIQTEVAEDASKLSKLKNKTSDLKKNTSNKISNSLKEKITDNWENRKLKSEDESGWLTKLGIKEAKKAGFTNEGLGKNINQKLIDVLTNEGKATSKPRLALPEYKSNTVNKKTISGKFPVADEPYNPVKAFQESVNNLLNPKNTNSILKKVSNKSNSKKTKSLKNKRSPNKENKFKQGGRLISKFQNSGKITKGTTDKPLEDLKKRNIDLDTTLFKELPKLTHTLLGNRKNAQILSRINPVLMQAPTEIYKPVVTNLANENFVNNQVNSYLHQASKPMTSDASLQKGIQLEALSKTTPMLIQAKATNTDMYNQTLGLSNDSAEKYANVRNEVANSNRERIGAHQARLANIESGKNVADVASFSNFYDKANEVAERNKMYKFQSDIEKKSQDLQSEFSSKLKPFEENYNKLSDIKNSNIYKEFEQYKKDFAPDIDLNSTEGRTDGKTWSKAIEEEKEIKYKDWMNKRDELTPYYQSQFLNLRNRNPYLTKFSINSYKSGGELTAKSKVEVQQLKNKLKEKELDIKYRDKALDRKQKEVSSILNGLSKETFFLLKTLLGK